MNGLTKFAAVSIAALGVTLAAGFARATTFAAWEVADVAWDDTLNVRKFPASTSQKQSAYPNGTVLQMTGRCTGDVNLLDIAGEPEWQQRQAVRQKWCEVWHDPKNDGDFVTGWVYGKYIRPE